MIAVLNVIITAAQSQKVESFTIDNKTYYGTKQIPAEITGHYLYEEKGEPIVDIEKNGTGLFQRHGVKAYPVEYWIVTRPDGTIKAQTSKVNRNYIVVLILKYGSNGESGWKGEMEGTIDLMEVAVDIERGYVTCYSERFKKLTDRDMAMAVQTSIKAKANNEKETQPGGNANARLAQGPYSDGNWQCTLSYNADGSITLKDVKYTHVYRTVGNTYSYVHTNGVDYRIQPLDNKRFKVFHADSPNNFTVYDYTGSDNPTTNENAGTIAGAEPAADYKQVAEKYRSQVKNGTGDARVNAFCAAAAMARSAYSPAEFSNYAKKLVASLKQIVADKQHCPCADAIPQSIWDSVTQ